MVGQVGHHIEGLLPGRGYVTPRDHEIRAALEAQKRVLEGRDSRWTVRPRGPLKATLRSGSMPMILFDFDR